MNDSPLPDDHGPEERDELLAAEYVLGTLSDEQRQNARLRADVDGAFAARIRAWEKRFEPLNQGYGEVPVPDLLPQIEARLFGDPATAQATAPRRGWFYFGWRGGALATAMAAALVFLAVTFWPSPAPILLQAELAAEENDLRFAARWDGAAGQLEVTRTGGAAAPEGQDYELWLIDESGIPRSLGLLRERVTQMAAVLAPGTTLAISLEPEGGSPDTVPTGPVIAAAPLDQV